MAISPNPNSSSKYTNSKSPTEHLRKDSLGKEAKEKEMDVKPSKSRSPAVSKGLSHFMIPTISAASKINPSPRKKVLADRNEPFRTSLSFSDGKSQVSSMNLPNCTEDSKDSKIVEPVLETPYKASCLPKCPSHNSHSLSSHSPDLSSSKLFASSISPSIPPLDADPSVPLPYDPKTNYLSPRPQFLHYRPNPRLQPYLQKEGDNETKNLEDSFSDSESCDESELENSQDEPGNASSVEATNGHSEKVSEAGISAEFFNRIGDTEEFELESITTGDKSESENSQDELGNASPVEATNGHSEKVSEAGSSVEFANGIGDTEEFEPEPVTTLTKKRAMKSRFFTRAKVIPFLLVLLLASLIMFYTKSTIFCSPVRENLSSWKIYEESFNNSIRNLKLKVDENLSSLQFYKETLNDFVRNWKLWSVYSTYVNGLINSFGGGDKMYHLQFSNLTYMARDQFIKVKMFDEIHKQEEVESVFEDEDEFESILDLDFESDVNFKEKACLEFTESNPQEETTEVIKGDYQLISSSGNESSGAISFESTSEKDIPLSEAKYLEQGNYSVSGSKYESNTATLDTFGTSTSQVGAEYNLNTSENGEIKGNDIPSVMDNPLPEAKYFEQGNNSVPASEMESNTASQDTFGIDTSEVDAEYYLDTSENGENKGNDPLMLDPETEEKTPVQSDFINTFGIGTSQVGAEYNLDTPANWDIEGDDPIMLDPETEAAPVQSDFINTLEKEVATSNSMPANKFFKQYKTLAFSLFVLTAAAVVIFLKNMKSKTSISTDQTNILASEKVKFPFLQNYSPEGMCSSGMGSSYRSYSFSKGRMWQTTNEAQSQDRQQKRVFKRQSIASSSEFSADSPSYGSFTTYKRYPSKHGYGNDEVITPVRRSSRIKMIQSWMRG